MKLKSIYKFTSTPNISVRGFTLIEMIMVLVVLAIVAVSSFTVISSYKYQALHAAAERAAADLRYAKNLAIITTVWHGVSFSVNPTNTYSVYKTDGTTDSVIQKPEDSSQNFMVALSQEYSGITINSVSIGGGPKVEFNPLGVPYNDKNGAALTSTGTISLLGGATSLTVCISAESGRISIQ